MIELQRIGTGDSAQTAEFLQRAIEGLRLLGTMEFLPHGLLTRAALHRVKSDLGLAERDLAEVSRIASRSGMGLHLADYHLESGRLRLAQDDKDKAREHWMTAKKMIDHMGYHRRDKEVEEIEKQLG